MLRTQSSVVAVRRKDAEFVDLSLVSAKISGRCPVIPNGDRRMPDIPIRYLVILFVIAENKNSRKVAWIVPYDHGFPLLSEQR